MVSSSLLLFRARHYMKMHGFHATSVDLHSTIASNGRRQREVSLYTSEFRHLASENFQLRNYAEALDGLVKLDYTIKPCLERGLIAINAQGIVQ
jgi:hypothetical protein